MKYAKHIITDFKEDAERKVDAHLAALDERFPDEKYPVRSRYRLAAYQKLQALKAWLTRRAARSIEADGPLHPQQRIPVRAYLLRIRARFLERFAQDAQKEKPKEATHS